jgi:hypothetical protein
MKNENDSMDIYSDLTKSLKIVTTLLGYVIFGFFAINGFGGLITFGPKFTILIWLTTPLAAILAVLFIRMSFDGKPLVRISRRDLTIKTFFATHAISWSDFAGTNITSAGEHYLLCIYIRNPEKYLARTNWIERKSMSSKYKKSGYMINLPSLLLSEDIRTIKESIDQYFASLIASSSPK